MSIPSAKLCFLDEMGGGYFLYDTCSADLLSLGNRSLDSRRIPTAQQVSASAYALDSGEYACGQESATQTWLNLPEVQRALHVKLVGKSSFGFSTGLNYTFTTGSLLDEYKSTLIPNLKILQYSGRSIFETTEFARSCCCLTRLNFR